MARTATKRDAGATRQNILLAATEEFAAKGFEGARVDVIAANSNANKNMMYHYYGNKEALFTAVLLSAYTELRERQNRVNTMELEPTRALCALVCVTFDAFVEVPHLISLLNSENLMRAEHLKGSSEIRRLYDPLMKSLSSVIERGSEEGLFRSDVNTAQLYISIAALSYHYISNRYTLEVVVNHDLLSAENIAARKRHIVEMIMRYCASEERISEVLSDIKIFDFRD